MSLYKEWQLVAHAPKALTIAQGSVAVAIARRIKEVNQSEPIPQRTLVLESVGVSSRSTVQIAIVQLELLGIVRVRHYPGSRKPALITWTLECPDNCPIDHSMGNAKKAKSANPKSTSLTEPRASTLTEPRASLTVNNKEGEKFLAFIENSLEKANKNDDQLSLSEALKDPKQRELIKAKAEQLSAQADSPESYLGAIARANPLHLLPRPPKAKPAPDTSHLPLFVREALAREEAGQ